MGNFIGIVLAGSTMSESDLNLAETAWEFGARVAND